MTPDPTKTEPTDDRESWFETFLRVLWPTEWSIPNFDLILKSEGEQPRFTVDLRLNTADRSCRCASLSSDDSPSVLLPVEIAEIDVGLRAGEANTTGSTVAKAAVDTDPRSPRKEDVGYLERPRRPRYLWY